MESEEALRGRFGKGGIPMMKAGTVFDHATAIPRGGKSFEYNRQVLGFKNRICRGVECGKISVVGQCLQVSSRGTGKRVRSSRNVFLWYLKKLCGGNL